MRHNNDNAPEKQEVYNSSSSSSNIDNDNVTDTGNDNKNDNNGNIRSLIRMMLMKKS